MYILFNLLSVLGIMLLFHRNKGVLIFAHFPGQGKMMGFVAMFKCCHIQKCYLVQKTREKGQRSQHTINLVVIVLGEQRDQTEQLE